MLIWGFDKGFVLYDGGSNLLRYQYIQPSQTNSWFLEHLLVKAIIPQSLRTIVALRYIALMLNIVSSLLFGFALSRLASLINGKSLNKILLMLMMLAGLTLSYTVLPPELSYNNLSQFFLVSSTALLILAVTQHGVWSSVFAAAAGLATVFLGVTKIPTGLIFGMTALPVLIFFESGLKGRSLSYLVTLLVAFVTVSMIVRPDFNWFVENFMSMANHPTRNHYSLRVENIASLMFSLLETLGLSLIIVGSWRFAKRHTDKDAFRLVCLCAGVLLLTVYFSTIILSQVYGASIAADFLTMPLFVLLLWRQIKSIAPHGTAIGNNDHLKRTNPLGQFLPLLSLLFVIPYFGAVGAMGDLSRMANFYMITILGLTGLLVDRWHSKVHVSILAVFYVYIVVMSIWHYIQYPFGLHPLYKHTDKYKGVRYEPDEAEYFRKAEAILRENGFSPKQGIIAERTPGLVYLMNTFEPGGVLFDAFYLDDYLENLARDGIAMKPVIISHTWGRPHAVEMSRNKANKSKFVIGLEQTIGVDFYKDYTLTAQCSCDLRTTYFYFPKEKLAVPRYAELKMGGHYSE